MSKELICDWHSTEGVRCSAHPAVPCLLRFGDHEIAPDLCPAHIDEADAFYAPHLGHLGQLLQEVTKSPEELTTRKVREWAQKTGRSVPAQGRLPNRLFEEYKRAHGYYD